MNQVFDPFNIIILAVAVIIFFRLRSVLGSRTGNEKMFDPFNQRHKDGSDREYGSENVVKLPGRKTGADESEESEDDSQPVWKGFARKGSSVAKGLQELSETDSSFSPAEFISGARVAYELIVTAFANGDKSTLKPLLSNDVYEGFAAAIDGRKKAGETLESKFVGINKSDIVKVDLTGKRAAVTVKFVSDLITATRDKTGKIIDGDPNEIQEITDVWTFEREITSSDPNWRLVATEAD